MADTERPSLLAAVGLAAQRGWDQQVVQLSASTGDSLTLLRHLADLLTVREAALAAARRAGDTAAEGRALRNLGSAYQELRRFEEAIGCHQDALAIRRETGDRHGEGRTLPASAWPTRNCGSLTGPPNAGGTRRRLCAMPVTARKPRLEQLAAGARSRRRRWRRNG